MARPWERKFLGYTVSVHRETRLRIAPESARRLADKVRELMRAGRGRSLAHTIKDLNPVLRAWITYFRLAQNKGMLEELDGWVRRRLRCLLWRQWKRPRTRQARLRALGLDAEAAWRTASSGRGPWHSAGSRMANVALPARYFTRMRLLSLLDTQRGLQCAR
ncbi:MAG TPA: group II intron maturase-specific domain-containing protein [Steroidobacteraceae bacterium]|nr:group II intron maturase-specific domain-containing protein [Steroidobacteraceae bacterium]